MPSVPSFEVNAFTGPGLAGNPAAVCLLETWPSDERLQALARKNNFSETAYLLPAGAGEPFDYHLRWFTPAVEVDLCGHATLAAGHVLFHERGFDGDRIEFNCQVGALSVSRRGGRLWLDFPARKPLPADLPDGALDAIGGAPEEVRLGARDYLLVYPDPAAVEALAPDYGALGRCGRWGYIATAPGEETDFVSRCFFPAFGIDEDPVTGSAHCVSGPYWAERMGCDRLSARQLSPRGGMLALEVGAERVMIGGRAETVERGTGEI